MEVREYNEQEVKIMLMFLQNQNPNNQKTKFTGVCNTTTYSLKKGKLKYENKGRQAVNKKIVPVTQQRSLHTSDVIWTHQRR